MRTSNPLELCHNCGEPHNFLTSMLIDAPPQEGDICMCTMCGAISQFDAVLACQAIEIEAINESEEFKAVLRTAQAMAQAGRESREARKR